MAAGVVGVVVQAALGVAGGLVGVVVPAGLGVAVGVVGPELVSAGDVAAPGVDGPELALVGAIAELADVAGSPRQSPTLEGGRPQGDWPG